MQVREAGDSLGRGASLAFRFLFGHALDPNFLGMCSRGHGAVTPQKRCPDSDGVPHLFHHLSVYHGLAAWQCTDMMRLDYQARS